MPTWSPPESGEEDCLCCRGLQHRSARCLHVSLADKRALVEIVTPGRCPHNDIPGRAWAGFEIVILVAWSSCYSSVRLTVQVEKIALEGLQSGHFVVVSVVGHRCTCLGHRGSPGRSPYSRQCCMIALYG